MEDKYQNPQDRINDLHTAEAASRKTESEANILRNREARAGRDGVSPELQSRLDAGDAAQKELDRINAAGVVADLSGVSRGLSDSAGNFAANVDVLTVGGIGVEASNSKVDSTEPAKTAEEAGTIVVPPVVQPEVGKVQGGEIMKEAPKKGK